jgi:hypothetical protein
VKIPAVVAPRANSTVSSMAIAPVATSNANARSAYELARSSRAPPGTLAG